MQPYNEIGQDIYNGSMKLSTEKLNEKEKSTTSSITILNIPWIMTLSEVEKLKVKLSCNESSANTLWNCEADVEINLYLLNEKGEIFNSVNYGPVRKVFDFKNKFYEKDLQKHATKLHDGPEKKPFEIEVKLRLIKVYGYRKRKILDYSVEHPRFSNGVVLIDGIKVYVNKQLLAMHSKYFDNLFFGDFVEKNKKVIEIHGVPYDGFITFLDFIHPTGRQVELSFVEVLMQLADLFVVDRIMEYCEEFLIKTDSVEISTKMIWAEKFSLHQLMTACLKSFKTIKSLLELKKSGNHFDISDQIKSSLLERAVQIHNEKSMNS